MQNKIELRDYQIEAVQSVIDYFNTKQGNPLVVAATGSGKSVIIGNLTQRIMTEYRGQRILMCTHVKELIEQNYLKLLSFWPLAPAGIYSAGIGKKQPWCDIVYGGIQSMYKQAAKLGHRDLVFIDECHLLNPATMGMYMKLIMALKQINPYLKIIGFTATDWRTKDGSLTEIKNGIFTDVCFEMGIAELIKRGYLAPLISKSSLIQANLTGVKMTAGEFNLKQAEAAVDKNELTEAALDEIEKLASDRKFFLFFCAGVQHSEHVKQALRQRGWQADIITCETPKDERARLLSDFKNSTTKRVLVNNAVLTTGTDLPNIDCIVLLRATASSVLYIQMLGRGMRLSPDKKNCLVLDYAGNIERFGAVDLIRRPTGTKKKGEKAGIAPQKICPQCREPILIMLKECPTCAYEFLEDEKPVHSHVATTAAIMAAEILPERYEVTNVKYASHIGKSGIPTLKVSYFDNWGLIASEYICFEHTGFARRKAEQWHEKRILTDEQYDMSIAEVPIDIQKALEVSINYYKPIAIFTKKSGKYQEITDYEF